MNVLYNVVVIPVYNQTVCVQNNIKHSEDQWDTDQLSLNCTELKELMCFMDE